MLEIAHATPCFSYGKPPLNPDLPPNQQIYWQKRRQVSVSISKYFAWWYRAVWDCDVAMSTFFTNDPDDNNVRQKSTLQSLMKEGSVQLFRENKQAQYNDDGTTSFVPIPDFNEQIPEEWLIKQRYNLCVRDLSNIVDVYFTARYRITGELIGSKGLNEKPITSWSGAPLNASQISITSLVANQTRYFYAAYTQKSPFKFQLLIPPDNQTYYDPTTKEIWPNLVFFGYNGLGANWEGLATADIDQPSNYPTNTSLQVDGVPIPAGTDWMKNGTSGMMNISIQWHIVKERDL
jgi:hypothetical protein